MTFINLELQDIIRTARKKELRREWREASLKPGPPAGKCETEDLDMAIENAPFHEDPYPLGGDAKTQGQYMERLMQQVCVCGHKRVDHYEAQTDCDFRSTCGCISFEGEVTNR